MNYTDRPKPTYFASCPRAMEELLVDEIKKQRISDVKIHKGGVSFQAEEMKAFEVILESRIASRVFKEIYNFEFGKEKDIYHWAKKQNWPSFFSLRQTFKINTLLDYAASSSFRNSIAISQILKDGIVDKFREVTRKRPDVDLNEPEITFLLRIEHKTGRNKLKQWNGRILIDLCGNEPLSNRGYRRAEHSAPMRENLAAGIILSTDWDPKKDTFIDSMCGQGTLLIEALLIKERVPPTFLKIKDIVEHNATPFAFMKHKWFQKNQGLVKKFRQRVQAKHEIWGKKWSTYKTNVFYGFDISSGALKATEKNLRRAVIPPSIIPLARKDARSLRPVGRRSGIVICNPPYGERMEEDDDRLRDLYHDYGENLKRNFKQFRAYIFTGNLELRKSISLQTSRRITMYNGNIECRLLKYELF
ncbi:MAG: hypothetical protein ISR65_11640 [Bacteriovoracaceae bacterium]|nr:hypothetical protein [Bacteriovoracaceae bacterium]